MMMKRLVVVAVLLASARALAQPPPGTPPAPAPGDELEATLDKGYQKFQDLDYREAIDVLQPIRKSDKATQAQKLRALELIGISYLILGDSARAVEAFEDLLAIDPGYQLKHDDGSPKIRTFFDDVKRKFVPGAPTKMPNIELEHSAPTGATAGRPVELDAVVRGRIQKVADVILKWRQRGVLTYAQTSMRRIGTSQVGKRKSERWRARFTPPASRTGYAVDYYMEARNAAGGSIGRVGGPETPLALDVRGAGGGEEDTSRPWYTRWYVYAGGAAVLGIAATAVILSSGGDPGDGTLDPGRVTLTP
jgi:tetratricopeptide (TPR) repeat protein